MHFLKCWRNGGKMDQYGKYASFLTLFMMTLGTAWLCARGAELDRYVAANVFDAEAVEVKEIFLECETEEQSGEVQETVLEMPARDVEQPEEKEECELSSKDYETLLKIVEAEAGTEDQKGRILVANVVLNRVEDGRFPDTAAEVVYQKEGGVCQFSPVADGRLSQVEVSKETVQAVEKALSGTDFSEGALYFAARDKADPENMSWFDRNLVRLFAYGGHEFFR